MPRTDNWLIVLATPIRLLVGASLNFALTMAGAETLAPAPTPASDGTCYADPDASLTPEAFSGSLSPLQPPSTAPLSTLSEKQIDQGRAVAGWFVFRLAGSSAFWADKRGR